MDASVHIIHRKTCRTCLKQYESRKDLISLFDCDQTFSTTNKIRFCDMLTNISHQVVSEHDYLPKKICILCLSQIRSAYFFKSQADKSYELLLKQYNLTAEKQFQEAVIKKEKFNVLPVISSPRHVGNYDILVENDQQAEEYSDQEIIDYEPGFQEEIETDSLHHSQEEQTSKGKSPDSGISESTKHNLRNKTPCRSTIASESSFSPTNCRYCRRKFSNKVLLKHHVKVSHSQKYDEFRLNGQNVKITTDKLTVINSCSTCEKIFCSKEALIKHHYECDHKCIECGIKIMRRDFYFKHYETTHNIHVSMELLECPFCMTTFHSEKVLQDHIQRLHPDENQSNIDSISEAGESTSNEGFQFDCKPCGSRFSSFRALRVHQGTIHKKDETAKTSNVPKYSKDEFMEKFVVKKSNDFYRCLACKKEVYKRSLNIHLRTKHSAIRSYRCELCPAAFFRADYRGRHFASTHPNAYKCDECDIQFDRAYKFDAHNVQHGIPAKALKVDEGKDRYDLALNDIKFIEDASNYDYTDDDALLRPESRATSILSLANTEPPMTKDEFCDKYIGVVSDKLLNCVACQQDIQKASLISHLTWRHAIKKPLKCSFCNERVVKSQARLVHMSKCHPNEYKCADCGVQMAKHSLLSDHVKEYHRKKLLTKRSSGEEDDLQTSDLRFVASKNEDEVIIEETEISYIDSANIEKKYHCAMCPKTFTSSKNLQIHKSHKHRNEASETVESASFEATLEEPMTYDEFRQNWVEDINATQVKCLVCDQLMLKRSYALHIKTRHCSNGAYLCAVCPERFYRPEHRVQHMAQKHEGIFNCNTCNIQFLRNSKYAKHMSQIHAISIENTDEYEIDPDLYNLKFVPTVKRQHDEENYNSLSLNSLAPDEVADPMEEMMQQFSSSEEMTRNEFIAKYITPLNRETKHCNACNKKFTTASLYYHLIHFHAVTYPFKCPFCDLRLERTVHRAKHLQIFHPNEYKCIECGLQFPKHSKFYEHMISEHNSNVTIPKSPLEEEDLSSSDLRYVAHRLSDEMFWNEENEILPIGNSTMNNEFLEPPEPKEDFPRNKIKSEPQDHDDGAIVLNSVLSETYEDKNAEYSYQDFKNRFIIEIDNLTMNCVPCNRVIIKTSVAAHLRLWHANAMMFNCELCSEGFKRNDYRVRHMLSAHPNDFKCHLCLQQFHRSALYKDHMKETHEIIIKVQQLKTKEEIDVPLENMKFVQKITENNQSQDAVRPRRRLSLCMEPPINPNGGGYTYKEFLNKFIVEDGESFKCTICQEYVTKFSIKKHLKRYHATSRPYNCELCDSDFQRIEERMKHMRHVHPDDFKCDSCVTQFYLSSNYIEHMKTMHDITVDVATSKRKIDVDVPLDRLRFKPEKFEDSLIGGNNVPSSKRRKFDHLPDDAEMTGEQFRAKFFKKIRIGTELHTQCMACLKVFKSKNRYFHLLYNHSVLKPYGCELCPRRFINTFKRAKHMSSFHANDYKCEKCDIQFMKSQSFSNHMLESHGQSSEAEPFDEIDVKNENMRFVKKSTSERQLAKGKDDLDDIVVSSLPECTKCDICNIEFDSSRSYRQHMREHGTGSGPIEIPKLPIKSEKPMTEMPKEAIHQCNLCEKKFLAPFALNAHKKFKHGVGCNRKVDKSKLQQKYTVDCDICNYSAHRRDYIELHVRQAHKEDFHCHICSRNLSSFNCYINHLHNSHSKSEINLSKLFKCTHCYKSFNTEESMKQHVKTKHEGQVQNKGPFHCECCLMTYQSQASYNVHLEQYTHRNVSKLIEKIFSKTFNVENIKTEKMNDDLNDEPPAKRLQIDESSNSNSDVDKLDYLKYLKNVAGGFKCGICGKTKKLRKYLLQHLKQHKEIPTYECTTCSERFVFKKKYDKHMAMHDHVETLQREAVVVENEHPKFQEIKKEALDIRCQICQITFKFTIMLNKHNSTWHADDNPIRHLTMSEQKSKKTTESGNNEVAIIKLLRCKHCMEAFIKQEELKNHLKLKHNSDSVDQLPDEEQVSNEKKFKCSYCKCEFDEKKYFENHQKFFCINRTQEKKEAAASKVINEQ